MRTSASNEPTMASSFLCISPGVEAFFQASIIAFSSGGAAFFAAGFFALSCAPRDAASVMMATRIPRERIARFMVFSSSLK